tara:strand:- start:296 stop:613 length:318 start_codon:yes stop_codon:yes gene_type:complete
MNSTITKTIENQELLTSGLVDSTSLNSVCNFNSSKLSEVTLKTTNPKEDFAYTFICHLIFYAFFCVALVLHIFIDLGLGSFIKNIFVHLNGLGKNTLFEKVNAFA